MFLTRGGLGQANEIVVVDVINVLSVTGPAQANQMIENDNDDTQAALYWRQGLNVLTNELSVGRQVCKLIWFRYL